MRKKNKNKQHNQSEVKQTLPAKSEQVLASEFADIKFQIESLQKEIVSFNVDKEKKEKELTSLQSNIEKLENELKDVDNSKLSKIDSKSFSIQFPATLLPKIGVLYQNKNRDLFLTIQNWEDLEMGKEEASRLNAVLCINKKQENQNQTTEKKDNVW